MDYATIIQYSFLNTDKLIDYYRQTTEPIRETSLDYIKLQKDFINAFQPKWLEHMKTNVDNYLVFQDKMIMLYNQMYNGYLKNIYEIKINNNNNFIIKSPKLKSVIVENVLELLYLKDFTISELLVEFQRRLHYL